MDALQGSGPPVIGVCKEQELPDKPDDLGIAEFDSQYFSCGTLYLDEERTLYKLLGERKIGLPMGKVLNPFKCMCPRESNPQEPSRRGPQPCQS